MTARQILLTLAIWVGFPCLVIGAVLAVSVWRDRRFDRALERMICKEEHPAGKQR